MPLVNLPRRKQKKPKRDKPRDARDKFVKQLLLRESDERQRTQQELMQLMQQLNTLIRKEQKMLPAYHRHFKDEDPRSLFYYRMLRRIGFLEVHARFAPWFLKSNQIVLNRWSSVLFARLEQAFYARPEALSTLEVRMREHQAQYDAIMKPGRQLQDGYTPSLSSPSSTKALEPREQNQLLLERAFRDCSFHHQHQDKNNSKKSQQQQRKTIATIQQEDALALEKLELIPHVPIVNAPPGLAPQVRGKLESHGNTRSSRTTVAGKTARSTDPWACMRSVTAANTAASGGRASSMARGVLCTQTGSRTAVRSWTASSTALASWTALSRQERVFKEQWPMCLLGEAIRMVKREREGAAEKEESWYRQLLRVRDDLRALDLQYAFWDAEEARMAGSRRLGARSEKREAQAAAKKAFTEKAQKEEEDEDDKDGSESGEEEEEDESGEEEDDGDNEEERGESEGEEGGDDEAEPKAAE